MKKAGFIYKITNIINGKIYIGSTVKPIKVRLSSHINEARRKNKCKFHKAINKYGKDGFKIEELFFVFDSDNLDEIEQSFISMYNSMDDKIGYNTIPTGTGRVYIRNIMLAEWADLEKRAYRIERMRKGSEHRYKPIVSVCIISGKVAYYESVHSAMRAGFSQSAIYECLHMNAKTGQKHCWFYKTVDDVEHYKSKALEILGSFKDSWNRPIIRINKQNTEEVVYSKISDVKDDGFKPKEVARVLRGERNMAGGYMWKFQ